MSTVVKNRYSEKDLEEFKGLIEEKIEKAKEDLALLKSSYMNNGNNGTQSSIKAKLRSTNEWCRK